MSFCVLIPARMASSRLPDKPLADIAGVPMVVRVAQRAQQSQATRVVIAADDERILQACAAHNIEAVLTSTDHPSGSDRLAQACELLKLDNNEIVKTYMAYLDLDGLANAAEQLALAFGKGTLADALKEQGDFGKLAGWFGDMLPLRGAKVVVSDERAARVLRRRRRPERSGAGCHFRPFARDCAPRAPSGSVATSTAPA